ncbi:hypothetical protein ABZW32_27760 [Streptomyces sp. NPDC004667]|uniref:hypothetical protein n=1 Tax=Streptomyces sp. NPDC004667 TaxID=3154285 RepID=UPI0033A22DEA
MTRTTPPRPLDVEALFPELAAHRGTTTRLHPRPGRPGVGDSSVGGPMLWPADEPWPVCTAKHKRSRGRRPEDVHRERQVLDAAWERDPVHGPTDEERALLEELRRRHRVPEAGDTDPLPMIGVAQLYRRDLPDLPAGPDGCDLLQVFWCPFDAHGVNMTGMALQLLWRCSSELTEAATGLLLPPPRPQVVGSPGYVVEPCVLHPEQVVTYPFAGLLPEDLCDRIHAREDALDELAEEEADARALAQSRAQAQSGDGEYEEGPDGLSYPAYQYDLSIPPGWRVGGFASWHLTDPAPMDCTACATPMELLLTVDSSEWDGGSGSWRPLEDRGPGVRVSSTPTEAVVGRWGELNVFACPSDPGHPHRWSIQ